MHVGYRASWWGDVLMYACMRVGGGASWWGDVVAVELCVC